MCAVQEKINQD